MSSVGSVCSSTSMQCPIITVAGEQVALGSVFVACTTTILDNRMFVAGEANSTHTAPLPPSSVVANVRWGETNMIALSFEIMPSLDLFHLLIPVLIRNYKS